MKYKIGSIYVVVIAFLISCNTKHHNQKVEEINEKDSKLVSIDDQFDTKADKLLKETIEAHGGSLYDTASYSFVFREKEYTFTNDTGSYLYTVKSLKAENEISDVIKNGSFVRYVNQEKVSLSQKDIDTYSEALNSVIYFATLPHKLKDKAVNKSYKGYTTIKGKKYDVLEITFDQEGGGKDYDDEFYYWINSDTRKIDYLAYNYKVNKGGVRFREAYNRRIVDGITFQDYINYKAIIDTPLKKLPDLYENGQLKELSRIKTENVISLHAQN